MKKVVLLIVGMVLTLVGYWGWRESQRVQTPLVSQTTTKTDTLSQDKVETKKTSSGLNQPLPDTKSLFITYWGIGGFDEKVFDYDRLIYFGVAIDQNGVQRQTDGYRHLKQFVGLASDSQEKYLTVTMTDNEANLALLDQAESVQQRIWSDVVNVAQDNGFQGVVLDLELSQTLSREKTVLLTDRFVSDFARQIRSAGLHAAVVLPGDLFYRHRPYDLAGIAKVTDEIMIMAYDFHKSRGEPGPNFPLAGKATYGYDMQTMISDYRRAVPQGKITVVFGMFGYDWTVDEKKRPIKEAESLTLKQITTQFIDQCRWQDCVVRRDDLARETEVDYVYSQVKDDYGLMDFHIVWFDDDQSVQDKISWLRRQGINRFVYWAWGYF
ncbi:glycosyl hydrolase family 18 protein [Patescibacteria group bacterium]|nr:glycosyl hydrolase family 18 protein [Patescibacteria group bacterium]MCL5092014.1 glycosyl hydrolase family 18 protein [Patescibacteria group bacterium]